MATVFARVVDIEPEEFKRATEVTYLGTVYGTMAALRRMTARDRGNDRPGRLGAVLPGDPAAGGVLRGEVRDPRLHRLDPHRAAARQEQRAHHDGPAARRQHDPVQLVSLQAAQAPDAGAADLPAGDPGRGGLLGRAPPPPRAVGRLQRRAGDPRQQARAELCRLVSRQDRFQRPADAGPAGQPRPPRQPLSSRCRTRRRRTGIFDAQAKTTQPAAVGGHAPAADGRRRRRSPPARRSPAWRRLAR